MLSLPATENPFKFGTVVDGSFFTERTEELPRVQQMLSGHNHLALISPRRYGKTGLWGGARNLDLKVQAL